MISQFHQILILIDPTPTTLRIVVCYKYDTWTRLVNPKSMNLIYGFEHRIFMSSTAIHVSWTCSYSFSNSCNFFYINVQNFAVWPFFLSKWHSMLEEFIFTKSGLLSLSIPLAIKASSCDLFTPYNSSSLFFFLRLFDMSAKVRSSEFMNS